MTSSLYFHQQNLKAEYLSNLESTLLILLTSFKNQQRAAAAKKWLQSPRVIIFSRAKRNNIKLIERSIPPIQLGLAPMRQANCKDACRSFSLLIGLPMRSGSRPTCCSALSSSRLALDCARQIAHALGRAERSLINDNTCCCLGTKKKRERESERNFFAKNKVHANERRRRDAIGGHLLQPRRRRLLVPMASLPINFRVRACGSLSSQCTGRLATN